MSSREEMLKRVRRALGRSMPGHRPPSAPLPEVGRVLPPIPADRLVDHFESEWRALSGVAYRAASTVQLEQILDAILPPSPGAPVVLSRNPLLSSLGLAARLAARHGTVISWPYTSSGPTRDWAEFRQLCFAAHAGITGVDCVLAESGTLALTSETEGSQLASLAPPIHIALYTRAQVVESLEEALERLSMAASSCQESSGRSVVFVAGPSRTADIEQISIRGVHGPVEVHAILIEESCMRG